MSALHYVSYDDLVRDTLGMIPYLPRVSAVLGIPRSGMLPATIIATALGVPLGMVGGDLVSGGQRCPAAPGEGPLLVVDDSCCTGTAMEEARAKVPGAVCAAIYASPINGMVDYYARSVPFPRVFEWNLFGSWLAGQAAFDMDGVLCNDPDVIDDDGPGYVECIRNLRPRYLPTVPIRAIITNRLECHRSVTEEWLFIHGVRYETLVMRPERTAVERRAGTDTGLWKAVHAGALEVPLFVESHMPQAERIHDRAGIPVYCTGTRTMLGAAQ